MRKTTLLQGLEMEHLTTRSGLRLNEFVIERKEQDLILSSCRRCRNEPTVVLISGSAGIGKTFLMREVGACIAAEGGVVLRMKFEAIKQARPFAALSSDFNQYCDLLVGYKAKSDWARGVISRLRSDIGRDLCYLMKIIPKLRLVIHDQAPAIDEIVENSANALWPLHYLLCQFMNVILTSSSVPITLVADDLHWADDASIEVLYQILKQWRNNLLFVACCRDDKVFDGHKFWTLAKNAHGLGINVNTIKLDVIEKDALNQAFCDMMRLLPRQVSSLTDIVYRRTKGNLLYIHQLLTSLNRGLIHIDVEEKRYSWDEAKILSLELPDDVAACFSNGISELSIEVQTSLHILSMLGTAPAEYWNFLRAHST